MTPAQCRAARGLLNLTQDQLAKMSSVGLSTIKKVEKGETIATNNFKAIQEALERGGAIFIPSNGDGPGVRLRKAATD